MRIRTGHALLRQQSAPRTAARSSQRRREFSPQSVRLATARWLGAALLASATYSPTLSAAPNAASEQRAKSGEAKQNQTLTANTSSAPSTALRQRLWREGIAAFADEDYPKAAAAFQMLYTQYREISALFNLAQAQAKQGACQHATATIRAYLTEQPNTDRNNAPWRALEGACPALRADWLPPPAPANLPAQTAAVASALPQAPPAPTPVHSPPHTSAQDPQGATGASGAAPNDVAPILSPIKTYAGWVLVGVGAASLVSAVGFAVAGYGTQKDVSDLPKGTPSSDVARYEERGARQNTAATGLAIAAGITAGVGVYLLLTDDTASTAPTYRVGFHAQPQAGMLIFQGQY